MPKNISISEDETNLSVSFSFFSFSYNPFIAREGIINDSDFNFSCNVNILSNPTSKRGLLYSFRFHAMVHTTTPTTLCHDLMLWLTQQLSVIHIAHRCSQVSYCVGCGVNYAPAHALWSALWCGSHHGAMSGFHVTANAITQRHGFCAMAMVNGTMTFCETQRKSHGVIHVSVNNV